MALATTFTVLVHEWVSGGGLAGSPLPVSWAAEGRAMRREIAADFARIPSSHATVVVTLDARLTDEPGPWSVVRIGEGELDHRLRELARAVDFTVLIAPETRGVLAELTRSLTQAGADSRIFGRGGRAGRR